MSEYTIHLDGFTYNGFTYAPATFTVPYGVFANPVTYDGFSFYQVGCLPADVCAVGPNMADYFPWAQPGAIEGFYSPHDMGPGEFLVAVNRYNLDWNGFEIGQVAYVHVSGTITDPPAGVPEPSILALAAIGFAVLAARVVRS